MSGLFNGGEQPPQPVDNGDDALDRQLAEETRARVEDMVSFNTELIHPTRLKNSEFHKLVGKDFKISKLTDEDVKIILRFQSTINHFLFIGLKDFATVLHAELIGYLAAKSSVGGFEREALITTLSKFYRETRAGHGEAKRKLL